jgi:hypothetical protein
MGLLAVLCGVTPGWEFETFVGSGVGNLVLPPPTAQTTPGILFFCFFFFFGLDIIRKEERESPWKKMEISNFITKELLFNWFVTKFIPKKDYWKTNKNKVFNG